MIDFLTEAHSGWRYLVLLMLIINVIYFAYLLATTAQHSKNEKTANLIFAVTTDIQILLGIILLIAEIIDGTFASQTIGHVIVMLIILPIVHSYSIVTRRTPVLRIHRIVGLVSPIVVFIMIFIGLIAIDVSHPFAS